MRMKLLEPPGSDLSGPVAIMSAIQFAGRKRVITDEKLDERQVKSILDAVVKGRYTPDDLIEGFRKSLFPITDEEQINFLKRGARKMNGLAFVRMMLNNSELLVEEMDRTHERTRRDQIVRASLSLQLRADMARALHESVEEGELGDLATEDVLHYCRLTKVAEEGAA